MKSLTGAVVAALLAVPAGAQTLSTKSRTDLFRSQTAVLDGRAAQQYSGSVRLQPPRVEVPPPAGARVVDARRAGAYLLPARQAAQRHGVPEDLFLRLVQQESGWNPAAVSSKGALGLAQLMPDTARLLSVDPADPRQNLEGGARYLRQQYDDFGTWRLALAAYNAGPEAVRRHAGVPPYAETRNYVQAIWGE